MTWNFRSISLSQRVKKYFLAVLQNGLAFLFTQVGREGRQQLFLKLVCQMK